MTTQENKLVKFIKTDEGIKKILIFLRVNGSVWFNWEDGKRGGVIEESKTFFEDEL